MTVLAFSAPLIVSTIASYILGGLPFGYWFVLLSSGQDIRTIGSGNIGATNVQRALGLKAGLIVLLLDISKGFLAVWLAAVLNHSDPVALGLAAVFVMLGHCYPIFLHFKGGKAVACFIGAFLYIAPVALAAMIALFAAVFALSKYVSLGSIIGALLFPAAVWLIVHPSPPILAAAIFAGLLIVYRHKGNIARLRSGTENKFSFKGRKTS